MDRAQGNWVRMLALACALAGLAVFTASCGIAHGTAEYPTSIARSSTPVTDQSHSPSAEPREPSALSQPRSPTPTTLASERSAAGAGLEKYPWPVEPSDGRACQAPARHEPTPLMLATAPGDGRDVLLLGDSLFRETPRHSTEPSSTIVRHVLAKRGWNPIVVCWGGKGVEWGVDQVTLLRQRGVIPARVVIGLGTNDLFLGHAAPEEFRALVALMLEEVAISRLPGEPAPDVLWIDQWVDLSMAAANAAALPQYDDMSGYVDYNAVLDQECTQARNCRIVNWNEAAAQAIDGGKSIAVEGLDGIHLTDAGSRERAQAVARVLAEDS